MKGILSLALFFFWMTANDVNGQVIVNGLNVNKLEIKYCTINEYSNPKGEFIFFDYGQDRSERKDANEIQDSAGKGIAFKSPMDLLNYMDKNGWEYVDRWVNPSTYTNTITLFKKK